MPPKDDTLPAWDDDLARRFALAGFDAEIMLGLWRDEPGLPGHEETKRAMYGSLREHETWQGPPTVREMDRRLQREAENDPGMPAWIKRPWYVPREHMLAAEAILVDLLGFGYSAFGASGGGEGHLTGERYLRGLEMHVVTEPGRLPEGHDARKAVEATALERMRQVGIADPKLDVLHDAEPSKAFHGLMEGRRIRLGYVALGVPYVQNYDENW